MKKTFSQKYYRNKILPGARILLLETQSPSIILEKSQYISSNATPMQPTAPQSLQRSMYACLVHILDMCLGLGFFSVDLIYQQQNRKQGFKQKFDQLMRNDSTQNVLRA